MDAGSIVDRYELVRPLGRGGQGEVWEAVLRGAMGFRRTVALKLFPGEAHGDLLREARLGALVSHPNLGSTFDCGTADGWTWVSMALLQGPTLAGLLARGPLPPPLVVDAGLQVAAALAHVHALPLDDGPVTLLHLDVKPANVVVDAAGPLKLVDLGVAALAGAARTGGTRGYCPPEQIAGAPEPRSDLYALGVTLATLARGRRPWEGGDALRFTRGVEAAHRPLADEVDAVVPGLGAVIRRTVRARPADRYPDAAALGEALGRVRRGLRGSGASWPSVVPREAIPAPFEPDSVPRDPLVGRDALVREVGRRLAGGRVTTLVAPGGMGKTRVARAIEEQAPEHGRVGLFVDLVAAERAADAVQAVALALGVSATADDVHRALAGHPPLLLVLDNAEQVPGLGAVVSGWAGAARAVAFLVTSRVPLGLPDEDVIAVPPLSPEAAAALYRQRSPDGEAPPLDAFDGVPLAIELAALGDGAVAHRHRSLEDVLAGSLAALSVDERDALADLAVFAGPFTLEAACAVVRRASVASVARVDALLRAGLLQPAADRLRMLVPVREFARARASDAERVRAELRHGIWFAQQVPPVPTLLDRSGRLPDLDDVRAAHERASARSVAGGGEVDRRVAAVTGVALGRHLHAHGAPAAARDVLERAWSLGAGVPRAAAGLIVADLLADEYAPAAECAPWLEPAATSGVPELQLSARFQAAVAASRDGLERPFEDEFAALCRGWDELGRVREAVHCAVFGASVLRRWGRTDAAAALLRSRPLDDPSLDPQDRARLVLPFLDVKLAAGDRSVLETVRWASSLDAHVPARLAARLCDACCTAELDLGDPSRAEALARRGIDWYLRIGSRVGGWFCRSHLIRCQILTGRLEEGLAATTALLAEDVPLPIALAARLNAAEACESLGDPVAALRWLDEARALTRYALEAAVVDGARGARLALVGRVEEGLRLLDEAARAAEAARHPRLAAMARVTQLTVVWDAGRRADAEALLRVLGGTWAALPVDMELELRRVIVERAVRDGRTAEASAALADLLAAAGERVRWPRTRAGRAIDRARRAVEASAPG